MLKYFDVYVVISLIFLSAWLYSSHNFMLLIYPPTHHPSPDEVICNLEVIRLISIRLGVILIDMLYVWYGYFEANVWFWYVFELWLDQLIAVYCLLFYIDWLENIIIMDICVLLLLLYYYKQQSENSLFPHIEKVINY